MPDDVSNPLLEDLKALIAGGRTILIVGAGTSLAATQGNPLAGWKGLLRSGVERCRMLNASLDDAWQRRLLEEINGDTEDLLSVAQKIAKKLGAPKGGEYRRWLRETVGSLTAVDAATLRALADWHCPIFTTNYDSLLEEETHLPAVSWLDRSRLIRVLHGDEQAIVHLHGHWEQPESVILNISSYEHILADEMLKVLLPVFLLRHSVVFVGFGAGLQDPHFSALFQWARSVLEQAEHRHFRLSLQSECQQIQQEHHQNERVLVLPYGTQHSDLAAFLASVVPAPAPSSSQALISFDTATADCLQRIESLNGRATNASAAEYLRELTLLLATLWDGGARRTAWTIFNAALRRRYGELGTDDRLRFSMQLAEMMISDHAADHAVSILEQAGQELTALPPADPSRGAFLLLQGRVFRELCAYDQAVVTLREAISLAADPQTKSALEADLAEMSLLQGDLANAASAASV